MDVSTSNRVFEMAAELFSLLSTPTRLRIVCELCRRERNVSELRELVGHVGHRAVLLAQLLAERGQDPGARWACLRARSGRW